MAQLTAEVVLYSMLSFVWFKYLWELLLNTLQYRKCKTARSIPAELANTITEEVFEKSRSYALDRLKLGFVWLTCLVACNTGVLLGGLIAITWAFAESVSPDKSAVAVSCLWVFLVSTATTLTKLPIVTYSIFGVEKKHGFNKQTVGFFIADQLKLYIFAIIPEVGLTATFVALFDWLREWFFLALWGIISVLVLFVLVVVFQVIMSMLDKYTPLPEGPLKNDIEALAASVGFPLSKIQLVEESKRSSHGTAYVEGICCSKRIVLCDTLLANPAGGGFQNDEIVAILAHELGHWRHHVWAQFIAYAEFQVGVACAVIYLLIHVSQIYEAVGFTPGREPLMAGLLTILQYVLPLYGFLIHLPQKCYQRHLEYQADSFAKKLQRADALKRALIKLYKDNLMFPVDNRLYSIWYYQHPTLLERLKHLD